MNLFISQWEDAPARLPQDVSAWAIGDVHGQDDLLSALLTALEARASWAPPGPRHLILLGDYIDRGSGSIAALERAAFLAIPGVTVTALRGNHEDYLDRFLRGGMVGDAFLESWIANGGLNTLENLGVTLEAIRQIGAAAVAEQVRALAAPSITTALDRLATALRLGGYLFVHAGVHPRQPLESGETQRLTTIREPFLSGTGWIHDFAVVHGHSIVGPDIQRHRIGVDSGAFMTGVLSCVELRGEKARFIAATREGDLGGLRRIPGRRPLSAETWRPLAKTPASPSKPL